MTETRQPGDLLVVDDNRVNRLLLVRSLEQEGHTVASAEHGRQAMEMLRAKAYDLVLLDIEMPEMNGFQVLEELLHDPQLGDIPVIMTSASEELDRVVKCIEMGAEDYLTKPLKPVLVRARVNASLEKKRLRDAQRKLFRTFAAPEVAEELLRSGLSLSGKHVQASAMFADIRSFTSLAEKQDPADTFEMLNDYFALMFDAITNHGGTLTQMMGDGLLAVFGAPIPHTDHKLQAVRAAREMIENLEVFNIEQGQRQKTTVQIGIGIASGTLIAGYSGTKQRATYTCVGDTVNLAARIEAHTKIAGQRVLIDKTTREGLPAEIKVEELGPVLFKGKTESVDIFSVTL
jgi:class 3 adenylate cyclase